MVRPAGPDDPVGKGAGAEAQGDHRDGDHGLDSGFGPGGKLALAQGGHHPVEAQAGHHRDHRGHQEHGTDDLHQPGGQQADQGAEQGTDKNRHGIRQAQICHEPVEQIGQGSDQA